MPYNPTATFVANVLPVNNGELGNEDVFNRPVQNLDSRTLYLKQEVVANDADILALGNSLSALSLDFSNLVAEVGALTSDDIEWSGSNTIPAGGTVTEAVELAASLGGGGGGPAGALILRYGLTSLAGTVINHSIGSVEHAVSLILSTTGAITAAQAASIGELYVVRGVNEDTVYMTGSLDGQFFDYMASRNNGSGSVVFGSGTFNGLAGANVIHNLGTDVHKVSINISQDTAIAAADAAAVGAIYVVRGPDIDVVYNTGSNVTLGFDFIVS